MTTNLAIEPNSPEFEGIDTDVIEEAVTPSRKEADIRLWNEWNKDKSKSNLSKLMTAMNGIIQKEVNRASGSLPKAALEGNAKKWAIEAITRYNPQSGVALSTYVTHYLAKIRRLNYRHQNMVRLPEEKMLMFSKFREANDHLTEHLNRSPTDEEIASHLEWKPFAVKQFKSMLFQDHYESGSEKAVEAHAFDHDKIKMEYFKETLDSQEKTIYESLFLPDEHKLSNSQLAAKIGVNENRLSYLKARLRKKIMTFSKTGA